MIIKAGKAGLIGSNDESDIKSCLASNYVYEQNFRLKYRHGKTSLHRLLAGNKMLTS
jgi:hypothetical protein